ncbi:hypothetical protein O181_067004, partial [Austropuccinia psidii MF-1]|nr:hypothetical protein [Austropuccinia psidii MF-1]
RLGLITFNADHKDYCDPSKSFSNGFSSATSCAALVGDSGTHSFQYFVHIPYLNFHPSLLSSRDEVLEEIQDVGEDNSVFSLHLFLGNMDLPPSTYHDSLEELWDDQEEPEDVETMMKVVCSVYHQYLDVFSKEKQRNVVSDSGKHPIAFDSCKPIPAELNYEIHDKELLGIFWALKHWRAFVLSLPSPFEVLTNHSSLQYFMSSKVLTGRQACWAEFLSEFPFSITYCHGRLATLPDAVSHRYDV